MFVLVEDIKPSDNIEAGAYKTDIQINHNYFGYTAIECFADNGAKYDAVVKDNTIWIVFYTTPKRDVNLKISITYIIDMMAKPISDKNKNNFKSITEDNTKDTDFYLGNVSSTSTENDDCF